MTFFDKVLQNIFKNKPKVKGAFGGKTKFLGDYKTLKVIPRSKRTPDNSDKFGITK